MPRRIAKLVIGDSRSYREAAHLLRVADRDRGAAALRAVLDRFDAERIDNATTLYVAAMLLANLIVAAPAKQRRALVGGLCDMMLRCALGICDGEHDGEGPSDAVH